MDRNKLIRISALAACCLLFVSCFDFPPIFSRPPFVPFNLKKIYGTYVATFTTVTKDSLWVRLDGTYRHKMYNTLDSLVYDETSQYTPFEKPMWLDPCSEFHGFVENSDRNVTLIQRDTILYPHGGEKMVAYYHTFSTWFYVGLGFEGHKKNELYFISPTSRYVLDDPVPFWTYKKVSDAEY